MLGDRSMYDSAADVLLERGEEAIKPLIEALSTALQYKGTTIILPVSCLWLPVRRSFSSLV